MTSRRVNVTLQREGSLCVVPVPFDPKAVFGRTRAPVTVTIAGHRFRSTISAMGGAHLIPLRRSHREAAGLTGDETIEVTITLDTAPREVEPPPELAAALQADATLRAAWRALSHTARREHAEAIAGAKRPETQARRLAAAVATLRGKQERNPQ